MAFTSGNDTNILQGTDLLNVGAGAGNDRYVLDASMLNAGQAITILDSLGTNTLQLVGGLEIVSSSVTSTALQLTLNNGSKVTILGANTFSFQTGGNAINGTGGTVQNFSNFVTNSLGLATVPTGTTPVAGGAVTVNPNGGTTGAGLNTYTLSALASVNEGATASYTLTSSSATDNSTLNYSIAGTGITAADIAGGLSGTVTLVNGVGTINLPVVADLVTEGAETFTLTVGGKTASTAIVDTSLTPVQYTLTPSLPALVEGDTVTYTVVRGDTSAAITLDYNVTGETNGGVVTAATPGTDFTPVSGAISFAVGQASATFTVTAVSDTNRFEGKEGIKVTLFNGGSVVGTSTLLIDDDAYYAVTAAGTSVNEGSTATFNISTGHVINGTTVSYILSGVDASDVDLVASNLTVVGGQIKGTATIQNNAASVAVVLLNDVDTEGNETLTITIDSPKAVAPANISVVDTSINTAPTFASATATVSIGENSTLAIPAAGTATDANGHAIAYSITGADAAKFNVDAATGVLSFKTAANFEAPGSVAGTNDYAVNLVATDSKGLAGTPLAVTVSVTNVNEAPTAGAAATASVVENIAAVGTYAATDVDAGDVLTYTLTGDDAAKFAVDAAGTVSFVTAPNYEAPGSKVGTNTYSISVVATDKDGLASTQAVTVDVTNIAETPAFAAATATGSANENSTAVGTFAATDGDGDVLAYTLTGADAALFNIAAGGVVSFKAAPNYEAPGSAAASNTYSINVVATDPTSLTTSQAVTINVANVNETPVVGVTGGSATSPAVKVGQGLVATFNPMVTDPDAGTTLTYTITTQPLNGPVTESGGVFSFTPDALFYGKDSFTYSVSDGTNTVANQQVFVQIDGRPTVSNVTIAGTEDTAATGTLTATDPEGGALTYSAGSTAAVGGSVVINNNGSYTFTPTANYNGTASFSYKANDGTSSSTEATVTINLAAVNDAPVSTPVTATVIAGSTASTISVTATDVDIDAALNHPVTDAVTFTKNTTGTLGTVADTATAGSYTYTPTSAQLGGTTDTFTVTATDSGGLAATSTVTVSITNNAATVSADSYGTSNANNANAYLSNTDGSISTTTVAANGSLANKIVSGQTYYLDVLSNDDDGDSTVVQGMSLNVAGGLTQPTQGGLVEVVTVSGKDYVKFTSTPGYSGPVNFTYKARDVFSTDALAVTGSVTLTVETQLGGTTGNDLLVGSSAAETLNGGAGNDTIDGGSGADQVDGGADNDFITFRNTETNITGNTGVDTLIFSATNNTTTTVYLSSGADQTGITDGNTDGDFLDTTANPADINDSTTVTGFENLDASSVTQNLTVSDAAATTSIKTGSGNDTITMNNNTGSIMVDAGAGNDTVNVTPTNLTSSDSVVGNTGTDTLAFTSTATSVSDSQFTNVLTVETLTLADSDQAQSVTLGTEAQEAGIVTVNLTNITPTAAQTIKINATAYTTSGITFQASDNSQADQELTGGAGNDVFYFNTDSTIDTTTGASGAASVDVTIAGGTGTDIIRLNNDKNSDQIGNVVQINLDTNVTGIEKIEIQDSAVDNAAGDATVSFVAGYAQTSTITIDGSQLDAGETLLVNAAANATNEAISVIGGAGDDQITDGSASDTISGGDGSDTISTGAGNSNDVVDAGAGNDAVNANGTGNESIAGGAGNDTVTIDEDNLISSDTIVGGDGTDTISLQDGDADTIVDAQFTNATTVEAITLNTANFTSAVTLGAEAVEAGIVTVTSQVANATNDVITLHNGGVNVVNACGNDNITGGTGNDSVTVIGTMWDSNDSLTGGTGTDSIIADNDTTTNTAGEAVTVGLGTTITGVENVTILDDNSDNAAGDVQVSFDAGYTQTTITIDGSTLDSSEVLTVNATNNVAAEGIVVLGGAASDTISLGAGTDNVSGAAGNDTVSFLSASFTSSDTVNGGDGTDVIQIRDTVATVDSAFTKVTNVEVFAFMSSAANIATLGSAAQAAGIVTVDTRQPDNSNAQKVDASGYTAAISIFLNDGALTSMDTLIGGSGNDSFISDANNVILSDDVITGGTGTDSIVLQNENAATLATGSTAGDGASTGDAVAATLGAGITGVEKIVVDDKGTDGGGDVTVSFMTQYTQTTVTIDASTLDTGETLLVNGSGNAAAEQMVILGGADADSVVLGLGTDNLSMSGGNDAISVTNGAMASSDTIDGGAGTDTLTLTSTAGDITDATWTNLTTLETVVLSSAAADADVIYVFGAQAQEAGITTITGGADVINSAANVGTVTIDASAMTNGLTINTTAGTHQYQISGGSGNDTITFGVSDSDDNFVQGGAGGDTITLGAGTSDNSQIRINLSSDIASGTTLANADKVTAFAEGGGAAADTIEFVGATLQSGGGGLNPLSTTLDNFNAASDIFNATALSQIASLSTGGASSAYVISIDAALKETADLLTQAGIDEAVTYLTGNGIAATTVASTKIIFAIGDSGAGAANDVALFLYDEGTTAEAGIQSAELKLIGVFDIAGPETILIGNLL